MSRTEAKCQPCWKTLSMELEAVLRRRGSLLTDKVASAYRSHHGKEFRLHGYKLKNCLNEDRLRGFHYNYRAGKTCLAFNATIASGAPSVATSARQNATSNEQPQPTAGANTNRSPVTVATSSTVTTTANRSKTATTAGQSASATTSLSISPTTTTASGKPTNRSTGTTSAMNLGRLTTTSSARTTNATWRVARAPTPPAPTPLAKVKSSAMERTPWPRTNGPGQNHPAYLMVDSGKACADYIGPSLRDICKGHVVAVQLEGRRLGFEDGAIFIIKIAGGWPHPAALMFDVTALETTPVGHDLLRDHLLPMFEDESFTKVVHDFTSSAIALKRHFGDKFKLGRVLDAQFALEALQGDIRGSVGSVIEVFAGERDLFSDVAYRATALERKAVDSSKPFSAHELNRAARTVNSLAKAGESIMTKGLTKDQREQVLRASKLKLSFATYTVDDSRWMAFRDEGVCWGGGVGRVMISYEMKKAQAETATTVDEKRAKPPGSTEVPRQAGATSVLFGSIFGKAKQTSTATTVDDVNCPLEVLQLVPNVFLTEHLSRRHRKNLQDLQEIVLDEGRRPKAHLQGRGRVFLCGDESIVVTAKHIDHVVGRLERKKRFGDDNRAGFPGQLHRLSVMRRKQKGQIFAATLRIGRFFKGSAGLIDDILFHVLDVPGKPQRAASILVLGEAGSGKTTVIRDVCRKISAKQTVVIVDTSNEIAGDGNIPHREAIGESRRIMVPVKADQHKVMTEALQNHTPQTIVVDEISNNLEARACLDIKARGVRMVASAHGDLQSLLKNPNLNTLLGGTVSVTIGDKAAADNGGNKVLTQRAGAPIFDVIIEIKRGEIGTWSIIKNVGVAVDALLEGGDYEVERRSRSERGSLTTDKGSISEEAAFRLEYATEAQSANLLY